MGSIYHKDCTFPCQATKGSCLGICKNGLHKYALCYKIRKSLTNEVVWKRELRH